MEKKGQVTIFIIIAIVIVVMGVLIYMFFPQIKSTLGVGVKNPQAFIEECIEEEIEDAVEMVSLHGGDINPTFFSTFNNVNIKKLCYTSQYCEFCSIQEPQLKSHIEQEIENEIESKVEFCFNSLEESYKKKGYDVNLQKGLVPVGVELLPERIVSTFNYDLTLTKGDTERYDSFNVILNNNLYELISIANSILTLETMLGGTNVNIYMEIYPNLQVQERLLGDYTKIYIITNREKENKFQFASRSKVLSGAGLC